MGETGLHRCWNCSVNNCSISKASHKQRGARRTLLQVRGVSHGRWLCPLPRLPVQLSPCVSVPFSPRSRSGALLHTRAVALSHGVTQPHPAAISQAWQLNG